LAYTRTQINALNGEWRIAAQIGDAASVFAEIFQPLDPTARYFGFGRIGLEAEDYYGYDSAGNSTAKYRTTSYGVELGAGRQFGTWGELRLGYLRQHGDTEVSTGVPAPDYSFDIGELFVRMTDDKLDSVYFPTKGHAAVAEWRIATDWLGSDSDYQQARLDYFHAYSWGRNSLFGSVGLRTTFEDNAPIERAYRLGGFLQLSGFDTDRLTGQHSGLARAIFLHRVADAALAETYLGASIEYGNVWQDSSDISLDDGILAGSLFLGVDLPIGPLYLGYGYNDASEGSIYLYLGPLFSF
jgi:NTE family protein